MIIVGGGNLVHLAVTTGRKPLLNPANVYPTTSADRY
jgi:hypothetical protein